jgi:hypothetical protein
VNDAATLRDARAALDPSRVIDALDRALDLWRDPESAIRERLRKEHPVFSAAVLDLGCDLGLQGWTRSSMRRLRAREVPEPSRVPGLTAVWLASAIPTAAFAALLHPLLAGSAVFAKATSADPVSPRLFRDSLLEADGAVGRALHVGEDVRLLHEADAVVVHGRDETVAELRARVPIDRIFVGYGHKLSLAAVGSDIDVEEAARRVALDVALYDGRGCLSPGYVLAEERPVGRARSLARALAAELDRISTRLPRGKLEAKEEAWLHDLRGGSAVHEEKELFLSRHGTEWTVILEPTGAHPPPGSLRAVPVVPIPDTGALLEWCGAIAPHVSSVGQAGWGTRRSRLAAVAASGGGSRVCPLGRMQLPPIDWHHDGVGPLSALVRRVDLERDEEDRRE